MRGIVPAALKRSQAVLVLKAALVSALLCLMGSGIARAQLALDVSATPDPVLPGELLRYEVTVRNAGTSVVNGVTLRSEPSSDTSFFAGFYGGSCNNGCTVVTKTLGSLSAGQSVTQQLLLRVGQSVPTGTLLSNTMRAIATNAPEIDVDGSVLVDATRGLTVAIAEQTEPVALGEPLTYIVSFANNGTTAAAGVMLQATVPDGTQFVSATQSGSEQDGVVSWDLGRVGVGQSGERRFTVQVTAAAESTVFSAAELHDAADPGVVRVRAEAATAVQAAPPLVLDVSLTPDPVQPNELIRYEFTVHNRSEFVVTDATLSDLTLDGVSFFAGFYGGSCNNGCTQVTKMLGNLLPGQSVTEQLLLRAGASVPTGTLLLNTARVTATNAPQAHLDRSERVDATRGLTVAIAEQTEPAVPGEPLTYIVSFANNGTTADMGVMLQATVPDGTQFVSATQSGSEQDGVVSWDLGRVGVGQSGERRFTVQVTAAAESTVFSAAELHDAADPGVVRVRAEAATAVQAAPPLVLDVTLTPETTRPNEVMHYEFTVHNRSEITVPNVTLFDLTLDGVSFVAADTGASCNNGCTVVTWTLGTLAPDESVTKNLDLRVQSAVPGGALLFNTASASGTNVSSVRLDRNARVCTLEVCEPMLTTPAPTVTPTPTSTTGVSPTTASSTPTSSPNRTGTNAPTATQTPTGTMTPVPTAATQTQTAMPADTATPTMTPSATATPTLDEGMVALAGRVLVPGPGALPGDHGQVALGNVTVNLFLCFVRKPCLAVGDPVASTVTAADGRFLIPIATSRLQGTLPVVVARINPQFAVRAPLLIIPLGQAAAAALPRQVGDTAENLVDCISEAAVRLLEELGFENYNLDGVGAVVQAVKGANATANFEDLTPEQAADVAQATAASDPEVQMTLLDNHSCLGDCDGQSGVTVDEIVKGVDIALGAAPLDTCAQFDADRSGTVVITELVKAVNNALHGCTAG